MQTSRTFPYIAGSMSQWRCWPVAGYWSAGTPVAVTPIASSIRSRAHGYDTTDLQMHTASAQAHPHPSSTRIDLS